MLSFIYIYALLLINVSAEISNYTFPEDFLFGVATASYQVEGAWNEGGKTENIWDYSTHTNPDYIEDKSNGDVACDSYHKWKEDVHLIKNLGVNFYRFSISWNRILPLAIKDSPINEEGVKYYSDLIDALLAEGIEPVITIFHWDTPQILEFQGGWLNETIVEHYIYYARSLFKLYGDRVKRWITFNEPHQTCEEGYSTAKKAPFMTLQGIGGYQCYHHIVIAHGEVYRIYEKELKETQKGQVGITVDTIFGLPATDSDLDKQAAERYMEFNYGWFVRPIILGNYPPIMIERVAEFSKAEGFNKSRLPVLTEEQINMINGSFDFLGLNHYSCSLCTFGDGFPEPSNEADCGVKTSIDPNWKKSASDWLLEVPFGMRKILNWIKNHYNNPPVLITENGWSNTGMHLDDEDRIDYIQSYLAEVLKAIYEDGCNVFGYTAWSLMDNFEWAYGYTQKFGLVHVDFDSPNRTRTPRKSYEMFKQVIQTRRLDG